jgi:hypothetical protein
MGLINRTLGIAEYAAYNYALFNSDFIDKIPPVIACAGGIYISCDAITRTFFNQSLPKFLLGNHSIEEEILGEEGTGLEKLNKTEMNSLKF